MNNFTSKINQLICVLLFIFFLPQLSTAQTQKGRFIDVSIGLGFSAANTQSEEIETIGSGFYAQGEYVFGLTKWFSVRPYAGFILTSPDKNLTREENEPNYEVTTKAFLIGGKVRITAPIPYVAPYIETGLGASIGSFRTYTEFSDIEENGLIYHIPFTIGLALGREHKVGVEFTYFFHPTIDQFAGAIAAGITFSLDRKSPNL